MSVIIRLQNLPWSGSAADIRSFFSGLAIPEGGVHIVGGREGDAFIAFASDEDARVAMRRTGALIHDAPISLLLSSRLEMQRVIETAKGDLHSPTQVAPAVPDSPPPVVAFAKPRVVPKPVPPPVSQGFWASHEPEAVRTPQKETPPWSTPAFMGDTDGRDREGLEVVGRTRDPRSRPKPQLSSPGVAQSPKSKARLAAEILEREELDDDEPPAPTRQSWMPQLYSAPPPSQPVVDTRVPPPKSWAPSYASEAPAAPPPRFQSFPGRDEKPDERRPFAEKGDGDRLDKGGWEQPPPRPKYSGPFDKQLPLPTKPRPYQPPHLAQRDTRPPPQNAGSFGDAPVQERGRQPQDQRKGAWAAQGQAWMDREETSPAPRAPPMEHTNPPTQAAPSESFERRSGRSLLPLPPPQANSPPPKRGRMDQQHNSGLGNMWAAPLSPTAPADGSWDRPNRRPPVVSTDESWKPNHHNPPPDPEPRKQPDSDRRPPSLLNMGSVRLTGNSRGPPPPIPPMPPRPPNLPPPGAFSGPLPPFFSGPPPRLQRPGFANGRSGPNLPPPEMLLAAERMRESQSQKPESRYAIVSRLPADLSSKAALCDFFQPLPLGNWENVKMLTGPDGTPIGMAYIKFANIVDAAAALKKDGKFGIRIRASDGDDFRGAVDGLRNERGGATAGSRVVALLHVPVGAPKRAVEGFFRGESPELLLRAAQASRPDGAAFHWFAEFRNPHQAGTVLGMRGAICGAKVMLRESSEAEMNDACRNAPTGEVWMSGLPPSVSLEELSALFSSVGCRLVEDSVRMRFDASGVSTGECRLALASPVEARAAVDKLDGSDFHGAPVRLALH